MPFDYSMMSQFGSMGFNNPYMFNGSNSFFGAPSFLSILNAQSNSLFQTPTINNPVVQNNVVKEDELTKRYKNELTEKLKNILLSKNEQTDPEKAQKAAEGWVKTADKKALFNSLVENNIQTDYIRAAVGLTVNKNSNNHALNADERTALKSIGVDEDTLNILEARDPNTERGKARIALKKQIDEKIKNERNLTWGEKFGSLWNGIKKSVTGLFCDDKGNFSLKKTLTTVAVAAVVTGVCVLTAGTAVPGIIAGAGALIAGGQLAKGVYKASTATNVQEQKAAWEDIGEGGVGVAMSVAGMKSLSSMKSARMLKSAEAIEIATKEKNLANAGKITELYGLMKNAKNSKDKIQLFEKIKGLAPEVSNEKNYASTIKGFLKTNKKMSLKEHKEAMEEISKLKLDEIKTDKQARNVIDKILKVIGKQENKSQYENLEIALLKYKQELRGESLVKQLKQKATVENIKNGLKTTKNDFKSTPFSHLTVGVNNSGVVLKSTYLGAESVEMIQSEQNRIAQENLKLMKEAAERGETLQAQAPEVAETI